MRRTSARLAAAVLMLTVTAGLALAAVEKAKAAPMLRISVREEGAAGDDVDVRLPLASVRAFAGLFESHVAQGRVKVDDVEVDLAAVREAWASLRGAEGDLVVVDSPDEKVRVARRGGTFFVDVDERGDRSTVRVQVPVDVVDALLGRADGGLDVAAALERLALAGSGDLVRVVDGADRVRVWIE